MVSWRRGERSARAHAYHWCHPNDARAQAPEEAALGMGDCAAVVGLFAAEASAALAALEAVALGSNRRILRPLNESIKTMPKAASLLSWWLATWSPHGPN